MTRHKRFEPFTYRASGFTLALGHKGQCSLLVLDFLPLSVHESPVLLAALYRSGLQSAFPVGPISWLRLSTLECLTSRPDCLIYYALC